MSTGVSVLGNVNVDVVLAHLERMPELGQEVTVSERVTRIAGAAGNAAQALACLGMRPSVIGAIGDDAEGKKVVVELDEVGVDTRGLVRIPNCATGASYGFVSRSGERAFVTYMGALNAFSMSAIESKYALIRRSDYVLLTGYFLMPGIAPSEWARLLERLKADGKRVFLDCGWDPQGWPQSNVSSLRGLLGMVDIFLPNEEELRQLSGVADPLEGAASLLATGVGKVVVKCGPRGSMLVSSDDGVAQHPGFGTEAHDTVGAGDAFDAGLLYKLSQGAGAYDCLRFANGVASMAISLATRRYPTADDVERFMGSSPVGRASSNHLPG